MNAQHYSSHLPVAWYESVRTFILARFDGGYPGWPSLLFFSAILLLAIIRGVAAWRYYRLLQAARAFHHRHADLMTVPALERRLQNALPELPVLLRSESFVGDTKIRLAAIQHQIADWLRDAYALERVIEQTKKITRESSVYRAGRLRAWLKALDSGEVELEEELLAASALPVPIAIPKHRSLGELSEHPARFQDCLSQVQGLAEELKRVRESRTSLDRAFAQWEQVRASLEEEGFLARRPSAESFRLLDRKKEAEALAEKDPLAALSRLRLVREEVEALQASQKPVVELSQRLKRELRSPLEEFGTRKDLETILEDGGPIPALEAIKKEVSRIEEALRQGDTVSAEIALKKGLRLNATVRDLFARQERDVPALGESLRIGAEYIQKLEALVEEAGTLELNNQALSAFQERIGTLKGHLERARLDQETAPLASSGRVHEVYRAAAQLESWARLMLKQLHGRRAAQAQSEDRRQIVAEKWPTLAESVPVATLGPRLKEAWSNIHPTVRRAYLGELTPEAASSVLQESKSAGDQVQQLVHLEKGFLLATHEVEELVERQLKELYPHLQDAPTAAKHTYRVAHRLLTDLYAGEAPGPAEELRWALEALVHCMWSWEVMAGNDVRRYRETIEEVRRIQSAAASIGSGLADDARVEMLHALSSLQGGQVLAALRHATRAEAHYHRAIENLETRLETARIVQPIEQPPALPDSLGASATVRTWSSVAES